MSLTLQEAATVQLFNPVTDIEMDAGFEHEGSTFTMHSPSSSMKEAARKNIIDSTILF